MKYFKLFFLVFIVSIVSSCKPDDDVEEDDGAQISNVRFTPRYFNSSSDLLMEWNSTDPLDYTLVTITGANYQTQRGVNTNSFADNFPANNYNFYFENSKGTEFGPFSYAYMPMVYNLDSEYDAYDETNTITWSFYNYGSDYILPTKFQVEYGTQGFEIGNGTRKSIFNTNAMIDSGNGELLITDNINQGEIHDFYIRSVFNSLGDSEWSGPYEIEFSDTYLNCETPIVESLNYSGGEVSISWNDSGIAYQFSFFNSSNTDPDDGSIQPLIHLGNSITYYVGNHGYFSIRSKCIDDSYTPWSGAYSF